MIRPRPFHSANSRSGSALLLALWALAIMSFTIIGVVTIADARLDEDLAHQREARALELAESGLALASHPNVRPDESILKQQLGSGESFSADLSSEASRLSINVLLSDTKKRPILERLFYQWGLTAAEGDTVIDCLADWIDRNENKRLNGAEKYEYETENKERADEDKPPYPPNRPFQSVEEMALVKNMDLIEKKKPDWRTYFTVWTDGKIDLNEASAEIISAVCEISIGQAEALVRQRNGPDTEPDTYDDVRYTDTNQVRIALGLTQQGFQSIAERVTVESNLRRITSTGKVGPYQKTISVLLRVNNQSIQYFEWLEP